MREQSLLTEIAFKRVLDDPATIAELVATVQLPERLRLLLLLTVADVKAVGPTIWNGWKGALIRDLYRRAMITMGLTVTIDGGAQASRELLSAQALSQHARDAFAEWQTHPAQAALSIQHDRFHAVTEITCVLAYSLQVFRELAGVMAWIGASIVTARLIVPDAKAAVIMLAVQNAQGMSFADDEERLAPLPELVARAQAGSLDFARELPQRRRISDGREVPLPATVLIDNAASAGATVVEISARDRLGLLYDLLGGFAECGLTILSAQLATYGRKAVDVFYVQNADGQKLTDPAHITRASRVLLDSGNGIALDYAI